MNNRDRKVRTALLKAARQYSWIQTTEERAAESVKDLERKLEERKQSAALWVTQVEELATQELAKVRGILIQLGARPDQADAILADAEIMATAGQDRTDQWVASVIRSLSRR